MQINNSVNDYCRMHSFFTRFNVRYYRVGCSDLITRREFPSGRENHDYFIRENMLFRAKK